MNEEFGYLFEYTLTREEARNARRRAQYFRLGHATGIVAYVLIILLTAGLPAFAVAAALLSREGNLADALGPLVYSPFAILAFIAMCRAVTIHSRPMIVPDVSARIHINDHGIRVRLGIIEFIEPWDTFTAFVWSDDEYLIMTQTAFLAFPKRLVADANRPQFDMHLRTLCLKQSPTHAFPVLLNNQPGFPVEPPHQKNL